MVDTHIEYYIFICIKYLTHKHKNLNSNPQNLCKAKHSSIIPWETRKFSKAHWKLACQMQFEQQGDLSQTRWTVKTEIWGYSVTPKDVLWPVHTHTHTQTHTSCTQTYIYHTHTVPSFISFAMIKYSDKEQFIEWKCFFWVHKFTTPGCTQ